MPQVNKDSIGNTIFIALAVCLVCSFLVSAAAVGLKTRQDKNAELDKKRNILVAAGFDDATIRQEGVEQLFDKRFKQLIVNLETGEEAASQLVELTDYEDEAELLKEYDPIKASKDENTQLNKPFASRKEDIAGLKSRENFAPVYLLQDESGTTTEKYVFPIRGRGLWSTLKGFIAVENDFNTIAGLTYYEHGETPGLGGEVDNPNWKALWKDKKIYSGDDVAIEVVKGAGEGDYEIDGLSGATITSNGVSNMLKYWMGDEGFGKFIAAQQNN